jgi:propanol-preferring alcohol dehydrogenase
MRTLQLTAVGNPLEAVEVPDPAPGPGEVVVRIEAAGICHSDVHYRSGTRVVPHLPLVPGHEVAGVIETVGDGVDPVRRGSRVCLHYLVSCGVCRACLRGAEQFCERGAMIGLDRDGGYAERIAVPERNAFDVPDGLALDAAAIMMCSSATALHALRRSRLTLGETVAVFGSGGLGQSAIVLAQLLGAGEVYAVDVNPVKLEGAARHGAIPVDASRHDPVVEIRRMNGSGVDVAVEFVGSPSVMRQAVASLDVTGRAVAVGITRGAFDLDPTADLVHREAEILGSADHTAGEIALLLEMAKRGSLDVAGFVTRTIPLDEAPVNAAMDRLESFGDDIRTVILPHG